MTRFHVPRAWPLHSDSKSSLNGLHILLLRYTATRKTSKKSTSVITKPAKKAKGMQISSSIQWAHSSTSSIPCRKRTFLLQCFHHVFSDASWLKAVTEAKTNTHAKFIHMLAWIKSHQQACPFLITFFTTDTSWYEETIIYFVKWAKC